MLILSGDTGSRKTDSLILVCTSKSFFDSATCVAAQPQRPPWTNPTIRIAALVYTLALPHGVGCVPLAGGPVYWGFPLRGESPDARMPGVVGGCPLPYGRGSDTVGVARMPSEGAHFGRARSSMTTGTRPRSVPGAVRTRAAPAPTHRPRPAR